MVKTQDLGSAERCKNRDENGCQQQASKIGPSTSYHYCRECLSPFGGLVVLVKILDLVKSKKVFEWFDRAPEIMPETGHYTRVFGILLLFLIMFTRVGHFLYTQFNRHLPGG